MAFFVCQLIQAEAAAKAAPPPPGTVPDIAFS